jgi:hypothetical protein
MTERIRLSDASIEAALARRAPGHADRELLASIVAAAAEVPQLRAWGRPIAWRSRLAVAAVAAALVVAATAVISGIGSQPPGPRPSGHGSPGLPGPSSSDTGPGPSTPASASPIACATATVVVATGAAMPPAVAVPFTIPPGVLDRGVYFTSPNRIAPAEIWSVRAGTAARIATVDGPGINALDIEDVSHDGSLAIVAVGHISPSGASAECVDLYGIRTDGAGSTRLTSYGAGEVAHLARLSADGRYIAFGHTLIDPIRAALAPVRSALVLDDLRNANVPSLDRVCSLDSYSFARSWAPGDDLVAAICGSTLQIQSPFSVGTFDLPMATDGLVAFGWASPQRVLIATTALADGPQPIDVRTLERAPNGGLADGAFSAVTHLTTGLNIAATDQPPDVSPDGRSVLVTVASTTDPTTTEWYVLDSVSGASHLILPVSGSDPEWSADGRSVAYLDFANLATTHFAIVDVATGKTQAWPVPATYHQGIWHIP